MLINTRVNLSNEAVNVCVWVVVLCTSGVFLFMTRRVWGQTSYPAGSWSSGWLWMGMWAMTEFLVEFFSCSLQQLLCKWGLTLQKGGGVFKGLSIYLLMPCFYLNYGLLCVQITGGYVFLRMYLRLKLCCWQAEQIEWISVLRPMQIPEHQIWVLCFEVHYMHKRNRSLQADKWYLSTSAYSVISILYVARKNYAQCGIKWIR